MCGNDHVAVTIFCALPTRQDPSIDRFYWFDVLSVNQHASQKLPQEWWGTTFRDAIATMGYAHATRDCSQV